MIIAMTVHVSMHLRLARSFRPEPLLTVVLTTRGQALDDELLEHLRETSTDLVYFGLTG